jgi:hypothetical protein
MATRLSLTRLPLLNDSIVIKQSGGHFFIAAPDSFIIDKAGFLQLLLELGKVDFVDTKDLREVREQLAEYYKEEIRKEIEDAQNKENSSNISIR